MTRDPNKIYLSKSNQASVEDVRFIREHLHRLGYEIVEHVGGSYNQELLLTAELMVMVGYDSDNGDEYMEVGKGQYQQLEYRERNGCDFCYNLYFTQRLGDGYPEFFSVETDHVMNEDNWTQGYGLTTLVEESFIDEIARKPIPVSEPTTRRTDPMTMEQVERMEKDLPDEYKIADRPYIQGTKGNECLYVHSFHLACITLFK